MRTPGRKFISTTTSLIHWQVGVTSETTTCTLLLHTKLWSYQISDNNDSRKCYRNSCLHQTLLFPNRLQASYVAMDEFKCQRNCESNLYEWKCLMVTANQRRISCIGRQNRRSSSKNLTLTTPATLVTPYLQELCLRGLSLVLAQNASWQRTESKLLCRTW